MRRSVLGVGGLGLIAVAAAGVGAVLLAARARARLIRTFPDPVAMEDLLREPPGEESIVERPDGTRLRVRVAGTGPTVVLAHGISLTLGEWNLVTELLLAAGYRVVVFDARGHGRSTIGHAGVSAPVMAADMAAVLVATHATDAFLVGHSMGGFLALEAVMEVPGAKERLGGLVLVASFAGDILDGAPQNRAEAPILRSHLLPRLTANPTIGTLFAASFFGPRPSPAMLTAFLHLIGSRDHEPLLPLLDAFTADDLLTRLPAIDLPTVIVCGLADRTTPPRNSQRLAAGIIGARLGARRGRVPWAVSGTRWPRAVTVGRAGRRIRIRDAVASVAVSRGGGPTGPRADREVYLVRHGQSQANVDWLVHHRWDQRIEGGESYRDIAARFSPFLHQLLAPSAPGDVHVLVTHGGLLRCMVPLIAGNIDGRYATDHPLDNTAWIRLANPRPDHLPRLGRPTTRPPSTSTPGWTRTGGHRPATAPACPPPAPRG